MKQSEIKDLSAAELQEKLVRLKKYNDLKMAHAISPIENPLQIRSSQNNCKIGTELTKRELQ
jgi:large subunit ribosomal protein L29